MWRVKHEIFCAIINGGKILFEGDNICELFEAGS